MSRFWAWCCLGWGAVLSAQITARPAVDFRRDIQPILKASCLPCHTGPKAAGQLRLDSRQLAMRGGNSGAVIVPGKSAASRMLHRILGQGGEKQMPLGGKPLTAVQISRIRRWIDAGAAWPEDPAARAAAPVRHWAYVKPVQPPLPAVSAEAWVRNPIDRFVLARLEREKLEPSPEASRETLIRRLSLDLIGLPPTLEEVDEFLRDSRPDAYERTVERLLDSPHYGER
jgi:hypothetical protein